MSLRSAVFKVASATVFAFSIPGFGEDLATGFTIPESTMSPDRRFGVTVPMMEDYERLKDPKNSLVEIPSGRVVAVIEADVGWDRMGHSGVIPARWSPDGSLVVWQVDGKWAPDSVVLLKLAKNKFLWQTNILKAAQLAILSRTRQAAPKKYASVKIEHVGWGSAYKDGFTIDVEALDPISLPMKIQATLTSDPKFPEGKATLNAHLRAMVDERGKFVVTEFALTRGPTKKF
jgi:hypothetical protein